MDTDTNEMEFFDFKKQFSVEIINVDEESDESNDIFLPMQVQSAKVKESQELKEKIKSRIEKKNENARQTVLNIIKDGKIKIKSDDSIINKSIKKKKMKSTKHKKDKKEHKKNKKEHKKNKKEDKKIETRKDRDLKPIDEMEFVPQNLPSDITEGKKTEITKKDQINKLDETNGTMKQNEQNDQFINDLLAKVSESLIHILEAYNNHVANINEYNSKDSRILLESKRKFTRIKHHFFQLSYCTTNIIILSRETDSQFTENFLRNTVKLAEEKNKMKLSVQHIQPLYYELISWVKQKKELQNLPLRSDNSDNVPQLRKQLSQPPIQTPISTIPTQLTPKVSIYNTDSQNMGIKISLEPNSEEKTTKIPNHQVPSSVESFQRQFYRSLHPGFHQTGPMYTEPDPLKFYNYQMSRHMNEVRHNDVQGNIGQTPSLPEMTAPATNLLMNNIPNQNKCMTPNCSCQSQQQSGVPNLMNMRYANLPSYEQSFIWKNENTNSNLNNSTENNVDTTRSSVSTDSGFISPQQQSSPLENLNPPIEELQATVTPLITHVTSLNPRALQIAEGSCHICRLPTKKKCLGCYQIYYCSYQCQRLDWDQHMHLCKYYRSANRPSQNLIQLTQQ